MEANALMAGLVMTVLAVTPARGRAGRGHGAGRDGRLRRRVWALLERELLRPTPALARSSSTVTSTTGVTSNASSAGEATTGRTTRSRTSTTGPFSTPRAAPTRS